MARRRKSTSLARPVFGGWRPPAPVVITRTRVVHSKKKKHRRRSGGGGEGFGSIMSKQNTGLAIGALALGYIDKQGVKIPTIPIIGRAGSIALGAMFIGKQFHIKMAFDVARAAIAIAAYELGNKGTISGVHGVSTV